MAETAAEALDMARAAAADQRFAAAAALLQPFSLLADPPVVSRLAPGGIHLRGLGGLCVSIAVLVMLGCSCLGVSLLFLFLFFLYCRAGRVVSSPLLFYLGLFSQLMLFCA